MEKLFDLLLEKVNDKTKQAAGLVSVMSRDDTRCYIKVRIWDLAEGSYGFHMGNPSKEYKTMTQFQYVKPYVNFEFPCEAEKVDRAFVTNEKNEVVLVSDAANTDDLKSALKEKAVKENTPRDKAMELMNEVPLSEGIPKPPAFSDHWDLSEEKTKEKTKETKMDENKKIEEIKEPSQTVIPGPDEMESDMLELPDYLMDLQSEKSFDEKQAFDMDKYRDVMEAQFDYFEPFDNNRDDYIWWRVENPVVLHEQLLGFGVKIRNFFNASVMMSFFKHGMLLAGIYQDPEGDALLIFGFPSSLESQHKPFEGHSVWVRNRSNQGSPEGYWLIYYDPNTKELLNW